MTEEPIRAFDSLRSYLEFLRERELLRDVSGAHWDTEIGALTESVAFHDNARALLFDDVVDYPAGYRVATNLYVTEHLQAIALGLPSDRTGVDLVECWRETVADFERRPPTAVSTGPIRENVVEGDDVDVLEFPVPLWHARDGGRFFGTGDAVFTRGRDDDWVNVAPYRSQVHDERTLGIFSNQVHHGRKHMESYWRRGESAPIAITGGQSPDIYAAGCAQLPAGYPELEFAGGLRGESVEVIVEDRTGLPIPARAEIAVIGRVPPPDERTETEGPFGECTGYYAAADEQPVVEVDAIWHRDEPILQGSPTMIGSTRKFALGAEIVTSARIWDAIEADVPSVEGVYTLLQQCQAGSDITVVSIDQQYAGHATQAAVETLGSRPNVVMNSMVIVVDDDIDPASLEQVLFALTTRCDPERDVDVVSGLPSIGPDPVIEPSRRADGDFTTSSMLIDACKPYHWKDEYPPTNVIDDDLREEMIETWNVDDWD